jgi:hypothetical protein
MSCRRIRKSNNLLAEEAEDEREREREREREICGGKGEEKPKRPSYGGNFVLEEMMAGKGLGGLLSSGIFGSSSSSAQPEV